MMGIRSVSATWCRIGFVVLLISVHIKPDQPFTSEVKPWYKYRKDGKAGREVMLYNTSSGWTGKIQVIVQCNGHEETTGLFAKKKLDSIAVLLPTGVGLTATNITMIVRANNKEYTSTVYVPAKKQWTVYIYPHAHVDIGYTGLQGTVEKLQVRNMDVGIDIARKTQHYPAGARFVWNPEATWIASNYLKTAAPAKKKTFIEAVKKGWVQLDGSHSNINASICSDEELMHYFSNRNHLQQITGVPITTMVQMDVPGASWGLVTAAAQNGVHGFINFPNYFDTRKIWEHKPFYWLGPDKKSRILFLQACPYGIGYTIKGSKYGLRKLQSYNDTCDRVHTNQPLANFIDPFIFDETERLEKANSPYDIFAMTWSMADNCLIDADLPEAVRQWDSIYAYPKLIIAGAKEILAAYEKKYAAIIPTYSGDFTEYWTDGLGSDARRVALSRSAKENLVQAQTLWTLLNQHKPAPEQQYAQAWENLLLAAEHTWGAQNPGTLLAQQIEANKAAHFENAAQESSELITKALAGIQVPGSNTIAVINTLSWARSGLVQLTPEQSKAGDRVVDAAGHDMLSQRLQNGLLMFQSGIIPALASTTYQVVPGKGTTTSDMITGTNALQNEWLSITINEQTGDIKSLVDKTTNRELVNASSPFAINSYHYLPGVYDGRHTVHPALTASDVSIQVKENGPLVASLLITSKAPGCNWLTCEVKLVKDQRSVTFVNTIDKIATREKEGIHYAFAFNVPDGVIHMDIPWGIMRPEYDQLPGANRNWMVFQRWVDVSNNDYGVTWTSLECPLIELGDMTGNILDGARMPDRWIKKLPATQTILSWPVNNHWGTNFAPEQQGIITTTCCMEVHGAYDAATANHFGMEQNRPLIAVPVRDNPINTPLLLLDNDNVVITTLQQSEDGKALLLRLRSVSDKKETVHIQYRKGLSKSVFTVPPYGAVSCRVRQ